MKREEKFGYKSLAQQLVQKIESGHMPRGAPLPSSREMAAKLGVSRDTVVRCYKHLQDLSYIKSEGPRGTFVCHDSQNKPPTETRAPLDPKRLSAIGKLYSTDTPQHPLSSDFSKLNYGAAPRESLPVKRWRELIQRHSRPEQFRQRKYDTDVLNRSELRQAIALHLNRTKNQPFSAREVMLFNNTGSAIEILCRLLLDPGDVVAVEEPGFGGIKNIATYQKLQLAPVSTDEEGLIVDRLNKLPKAPKLIYVTPNSQDPTGVTMSLRRRIQLLNWAESNNAWIIEDDFDSYFKIGKHDLPPLKSLDKSDSVIYVSTFWQVLYPLATTGFLVIPSNLTTAMERSTAHGHGTLETTMHNALAEMLNDGYFHKHVRKWAKVFGGRLRAFTYELKRALGDNVSISNDSGGLNCLVHIRNWSDKHILESAARANLPCVSTAPYYLGPSKEGEFLVYFAGLTEEQIKTTINKFIRELKAI